MSNKKILDIDKLLIQDTSKTGVVSNIIIREAIRRGIPIKMTVEMSEEEILEKMEKIKNFHK